MGQFGIVAIGSSAGGIKALETVLSALPGDFPAPILIVQHLDPRHKSMIVEIMQRHSKLRVIEAIDGDTMNPSTVYIAPPNKHLLVNDGKIQLTSTAFYHFSRPSIDLLFESIAATFGGRAIAVILTGSGQDGSMGIKAIKETGGTTIVQDAATSEYEEMPRSAISTGTVDFVLPIQEIAPAIIALAREVREERGNAG